MRTSSKQREKLAARGNSAVARVLAPEDVRVGDFVAVLDVTCELPSFLWCADANVLPAHEPVRIRFLPYEGFQPYRVESVCIPFVLTALPAGGHSTLDVRCCRLARLDRRFGKAVWKACGAKHGKRKRKHR